MTNTNESRDLAVGEPQVDRTSEPSPRAAVSRKSIGGFLQNRTALLCLLIVFAACYYGSYVRYGINFRDEGGTVALIGKRLLAGERPFLDIVPGYNVLWFYPVVGLFKVFGVNFVLLRAYFFLLSTIAAVLGFLTVERVSRRPWVAFLVGIVLVLVPGMVFKNYDPMLAIANGFCLVSFALAGIPLRRNREHDRAAETVAPGFSWRWLFIGAVVLAMTFLIRIDLATFSTLLWLGTLGLLSLDGKNSRVKLLVIAPLVMAATVLALHFPVWLDARHRGFDAQFVAQYPAWPKSILQSATERLGGHRTSSMPRVPAPPVSTALDKASKATPTPPRTAHSWNSGTLQTSWSNAKTPGARELYILLYLPLAFLVPLTIWAFARFLKGLRSGDVQTERRSLAALLVLGTAFTILPQYLFFRPDAPHLSEFAPVYWVSVVSALFLLGVADGSWRNWRLLPVRLLAILLVCQMGAYVYAMMDRTAKGKDSHYRWVGAYAVPPSKTELFHGANGVNVYVPAREFAGLNALVKVIHEHSAPSDFLVAYPYHPSVNLIADRPTYEKSIYVDNATRSKNWDDDAISRMEHFQPAVIVISDWEINGTPESRFSVWAAKTKAWIQAHYDFQGIFMEHEQFEVYTRKHDVAAVPAPAAPAAEATPAPAEAPAAAAAPAAQPPTPEPAPAAAAPATPATPASPATPAEPAAPGA